MNKQIYEICGVTEKDYKNWCELTGKPAYKSSTKQEFFNKIQNGQLVKDSNGNLLKKRKNSK